MRADHFVLNKEHRCNVIEIQPPKQGSYLVTFRCTGLFPNQTSTKQLRMSLELLMPTS